MATMPPSTWPTLLTRGPVRLWAAGSMLAVVVVVAATLAGHALATRARMAAETVAAPALPLPALAVAVSLGGEPQLVADDAGAGRVVVLSAPDVGGCPAGRQCPDATTPGALLVLDDATGAIIARTPLPASGAVLRARWLLVDARAHVALAVGPGGVARYATPSGRPLGGYPLPAGMGDPTGAALDAEGHLDLSGSWGIASLDAVTGRVLTSQPLPASAQGAQTRGLVYEAGHDAGRGMLARIVVEGNATTLLVEYAASDLRQVAEYALPMGARLGPLDPDGQLVLVDRDGAAWRFSPANPAAPEPGLAPARLAAMPGLREARALGWNAALGHTYLATGNTLTILDAAGQPIAALPASVAATDLTRPLAADTARGLLYVPVVPGALLIVRDGARPPSRGPLDARVAVVLARAVLARLLPPASQNPPFVAPDTFPLIAGTHPVALWQQSSDLGWLGPFAGTATTRVASLAGSPGAYRVTFDLAWRQLFTRRHTWVCVVAADGAVRLASQTGDAVS